MVYSNDKHLGLQDDIKATTNGEVKDHDTNHHVVDKPVFRSTCNCNEVQAIVLGAADETHRDQIPSEV
ncbi:hypothetical protein T265_08580 [Opisthorchis viverrini]|uniref:Uncharacterized protein n=1 Tax=Opisthorchis viverrini TaxID=6198 RepID=A0A074Z8Q5_OPIVI|nr:hypothetical protein T265_08580 [Opisthorchis viverrini]KER23591.1 hypothetical protein T265_08580 [Opisthorchis viverrini]